MKSFHAVIALAICINAISDHSYGVMDGLHFPLEDRATNIDKSLPIYKDPTASVEARVLDLLPRMSLEEKVSQIIQGDMSGWMDFNDPSDGTLSFNETGLEEMMRLKGGSIWAGYLAPYDKFAYGVTVGQRYLVENTTLGIPALIQSEGLHGFTNGGTVFPSPIGLAASFNTNLVKQVADVTASEAEGLGINHVFAPVLDLSRELRWGRVEENFGEDPYLTGEMGSAFVSGLQSGRRRNTSNTASARMAATCKHFAAFGSPQGGLNLAQVSGGERELRSTYLKPFSRACLDSLSIMTAYSSYDGIPAIANTHLLTDVLRNEWGYKYFVTTDAGSVDLLITLHGTCATRECAAKVALENGLSGEMGGGTYTLSRYDLILGSLHVYTLLLEALPLSPYLPRLFVTPPGRTTSARSLVQGSGRYLTLPDQIKKGTVDAKHLDETVKGILRSKFYPRPFRKYPYPYPDYKALIRAPRSKEVLRQTERESIVLLENRRSTLPLEKGISSVALLGPQANRVSFGDYVFHNASANGISPLDGFRQFISRSSKNTKINFAQGSELWSNDESGIPAAVEAAASSDVAIVMVGTWSLDQTLLWTPGTNATTGEHVDVADLGLVGAQLKLIKAIKATGKPTIVVFISGKPIAEPWIQENVDAIVQQFYPGELGGLALAEVIFGDVNPSGKLPVSFPRDVGTTPVFYNYLKGSRPLDSGATLDDGRLLFGHQYILNSPVPLWSFGHGLSYTTFNYTSLRIPPSIVNTKEDFVVSVTVHNTGPVEGQEVVQVYISDVLSSVGTPNQELVGFQKVNIPVGATVNVSIEVFSSQLAVWSLKNMWVVEPGTFLVKVGTSDQTLLKGTLTVK